MSLCQVADAVIYGGWGCCWWVFAGLGGRLCVKKVGGTEWGGDIVVSVFNSLSNLEHAKT